MKFCKNCGKKFSGKRKDAVFCSGRCRGIDYQIGYIQQGFGSQVASARVSCGTKGAIGELRVCVDLLGQGYEVFRAVSPSCSCDLIATKQGKSLSIEVRTRGLNKNGTYHYAKHGVRAETVAIVLPDKIVYTPPLDQYGNE
jgi:hypothetical protein